MQARVNQPVTCAVCGSDWFYEVTLQQYADMYSASPGGDIHPISTTIQQIRICVCGRPSSRISVAFVAAGKPSPNSLAGPG